MNLLYLNMEESGKIGEKFRSLFLSTCHVIYPYLSIEVKIWTASNFYNFTFFHRSETF